ncbi:MAG: polysaccharide lyase beta-sandwich domain-containing protein, partial [Bacteroidota bacterium]
PKYTDGSVSLITETRATKWQQLNKQNEKLKDLPKTENIFQMHIDHGKEIKDGKYAYIVYSGSKSASKAFKQMPLKIEANSKEVQAVTWEGEYLGAVFYDANAKLNTSLGEVSVSAPCAVLFERSKKGWDLTVTDAEMNLDIQSILVSTTIELTGDGVIRENGLSEVNVPMHLGKLAGKPAVVELSAE